MENYKGCCENSIAISASVDFVLTDIGIRMRHIPGGVCLNCRDIWAPHFSANPELVNAINQCLQLQPTGLTILKVVPRTPDAEEALKELGFEPAFLDIALGVNNGLVLEKIKGSWNWTTSEAVLPNQGEELRERLLCLGEDFVARLEPSLLYDTPQHPRSVQLEITTRCNLVCSYCTHRDLPVKADIDLDNLKILLDQIDFTQVENVDFTGLGEPILHPQLAEIIQEIRKRGSPSDIRVVTNGTALNYARFDAICKAGITSIAFSIDSMDPERFARSRGGAKLSKVMDNLEALVAYRREKKLKYLQIKIKAVLIDSPYTEADALLTESARLGLEMPHFSCLDTRSAVQDHYRESWLTDEWSQKGSEAFTIWAAMRWRELTGWEDMEAVHQQTALPAPKKKSFWHFSLDPPVELCRWAVDATFVGSSGNCLSCCEQMIDVPRNYQGALRDKNLQELWQEDLFWNYRLPLSLGVVPKGCVGCTWAPAHGILLKEVMKAT